MPKTIKLPHRICHATKPLRPAGLFLGVWIVTIFMLGGTLLDAPGRSSAFSENQLSNPGFEAGSEGWSVEPSTVTFEVIETPVHDGVGAAALTKTESSGPSDIYQDVPVTAGERYTAEVWAVWNDERLYNVKLRVEWLDGDGNRLVLNDISAESRNPAYQLLRLEGVEAPPGAVTARVQGYTFVGEAGPQQPALFDDFSFAAADRPTVTPAPTSTATSTPTVVLPTPTASPTATPTPVPAGAVVINEVFYDPPARGGDPDDEWVELYNRTDAALDLAGWVLADHIGEDGLPQTVLPPSGFAIVAATDSFLSLYPDYDGLLITLDGPIGNGLANGGDALWLIDNHGRTIDAMGYGDDREAMFPSVPAAPEGYSLERVPAGQDTDTAADWFPRAVPSPGRGIKITRLYFALALR